MATREKSADGTTDERDELKNKPPVKTAVTLSALACRKLKMAAILENKTHGELVDDLIMTHMSGYYGGKRNAATVAAGAGE
jgi:hypothetical protein